MTPPKTTVSVEDLLRVKRAERPPAEFWAEFDRELRAKQLAAIVEPRPWWASFIKVGSRISHLQLPISAAAVLAVTFVTIREYRAPQLNSDYVPTIVSQIYVAPAALTEVAQEPEPFSPTVSTLDLVSSNQADRSVSQASAELPLANVEPAPSIAAQEVTVAPREPSPSERYIAANLAAAQAADPRLIDDVFGVSMRQSEAVQPIRDPLAQVSTSESRRSRLLATALPVSASASDTVVAPSDRVARHLTEERLYDTITRVGVKGDRVAIKF